MGLLGSGPNRRELRKTCCGTRWVCGHQRPGTGISALSCTLRKLNTQAKSHDSKWAVLGLGPDKDLRGAAMQERRQAEVGVGVGDGERGEREREGVERCREGREGEEREGSREE